MKLNRSDKLLVGIMVGFASFIGYNVWGDKILTLIESYIFDIVNKY